MCNVISTPKNFNTIIKYLFFDYKKTTFVNSQHALWNSNCLVNSIRIGKINLVWWIHLRLTAPPLRRGQNLRSTTPQNHRSVLMSRPTKIFFFKFFFSKISLDRGLSDFSAILRHFYWQFPPFDFDRPSWPQFCLELGKIFSDMLKLDKILDWNLI